MAKKLTTEEFIEKSKKIHGEKYTYNKTKYKNYDTKVSICCPKHGMFYQVPSSHLRGNGCPKCSKEKQKKTKEQFIIQAQEIHGDNYDYSNIFYIDTKTKIKIKCKKCNNIFNQSPGQHLKGCGCPNCAREKTKNAVTYTQEEWVLKANNRHNNQYDYSKVEYINSGTKVCIICPEHGEFWQRPASHLHGNGCSKCAKKKQGPKRKTLQEFINKAQEIHNNKYNYNNTNYINSYTKVIITCPIHGDFEQKPASHLQGIGCPKCNASKGEIIIKNFLESKQLKFQYQKGIKYKNLSIRVDFYLEINNNKYIIEYNGEQHYKPINHFGGEKQFKKQCYRDNILKEYCNINNITLIEIKYDLPYKKINEYINTLLI